MFCDTPLWDINLTWYSESPDLPVCFHETVLVYFPCVLLWACAPIQIYFGYSNKARDVPWSIMNLAKLGLIAGLLLLSLVDLGLEIFFGLNENGSSALAGIVAPVVLMITFALALFLTIFNLKMGLTTSGIMFGFFFILSVSSTLTFSSVLRFSGIVWRSDQVIYICIYYATVLAAFFLHFWADHSPQYNDIDAYGDKPSPELTASFFSKMLFSWVDGLIYKGWKSPLTSEDLFDMNPAETSHEISHVWEKNWHNQKEKKKVSRLSIIPTMIRSFGQTFLNGSLLQLLNVLLNQATPNILSLLIAFVSSQDPAWKGYLYMVLMVAINIFKTILNSQYFWILQQVGLRVRSALTLALYKKSLVMSPATRKVRTVGETVNLMSIDTERFNNIVSSLNIVWTSPLVITLSIFFLWGYLGPSSLAGLAVMIILIPINSAVSTFMRKYQFANMVTKDKRIKVMNEVLDGIKVLKLYAWEPSYGEKIMKIREVEVVTLKKMSYLGALQTFIFNSASFMVALASFATYVLSSPDNVLDAEKAFVSLSYFNLMRQPLNQLPGFIVQLIQVQVSVKRINDFLNSSEINSSAISHEEDEMDAISMSQSSFSWDKSDSLKPDVNNFNINIKKGSLVAVVGQVGSGKSSFLSSLTSDMDKVSGMVNISDSVAYVPQQPWMQNASLRYNIIFGTKFDQTVYDTVVDSCAMRPDLAIMDQGDMTEIGEKGINLSGGQKQRVSLARAVYSNREIYLLDDPLSAVDAHVGNHIFTNVLSSTGLLKHKTRVLVTHSTSILPQCDHIIVIKEGYIVEQGSFNQLQKEGGHFAEYLYQHAQNTKVNAITDNHQKMSKREKKELSHRDSPELSDSGISAIAGKRRDGQKGKDKLDFGKSRGAGSVREQGGIKRRGRGQNRKGLGLMVAEKLETKAVNKKVYLYYAKAVGFWVAVWTIILAFMNQAFSVGTNVWLSIWSDDPKSSEPAVRDLYLGVYGGLGAGTALAIMIQSLITTIGGLNASSKLHNNMLMNVLRGPMSFFDTNPKGRVLNRFAKDVESVDRQIPMTFRNLFRIIFQVIGSIFVICSANPIFIAIIIPLSMVYWFVQQVFVRSSRQIKRIQSITRSPIYSHFSETLSGTSTIKAYNLQRRFTNDCMSKVDTNLISSRVFLATSRWLSVRLEMLGNVIILFASLFAVLGRDTINPGTVGLTLNYASQITNILNMLIRQTSQIESNMVSVERIQEYQNSLEQEAPYSNPKTDTDNDWPNNGRIEFENYEARYRPGLSLVLKGITGTINSQEKIGIVGRTGAGKSSLSLALFRIIEGIEGNISIDGVDISHLGLGYLRSRLTIMPQDPVLFSGTLRDNLDPFSMKSDTQIWQALKLAHLYTFISNHPEGLYFGLAEGGSNLSVGQKQLVCLARALLRKTKILVLDEATAAIDLETDDMIQETIRKEFADCTVLTIAHRLKTILDSDRVMVLHDGKIIEFDNPKTLMEDRDSVFFDMARQAGLV